MARTFKQYSFRALLLGQLFIAIAISFAITIPLTAIPAYIILNQAITSDIENLEDQSHKVINEHLSTGWQPHNIDKVYQNIRQNNPNAALFLQKSPEFLNDKDEIIQPTTPTTITFESLIREVEKTERTIIKTNLLDANITAAIPIKFKSQCLVCHAAQVRTGEIYNDALAGTMTIQVPMSINHLSAKTVLFFALLFFLVFTIVATIITNRLIQTNLLTPLDALKHRLQRLQLSSHEQEFDWQRTHQKMLEIDEIDESITEHIDTIKHIYSKLDALLVTEHETGLFHKDHFQEVLRYEMDRTIRYQRPFSLLIIKLVNVKILNATAKNLEVEEPGSKYLFFGQALNHETRDTDMAFRLEDNIFAIVAPETDEDGIEHVEKILNQRLINTSYSAISEQRATTKPEYEITVKEGYVTFKGGEVSAKDLLKHAIQTMQQDTEFKGTYPAEKAEDNHLKKPVIYKQ